MSRRTMRALSAVAAVITVAGGCAPKPAAPVTVANAVPTQSGIRLTLLPNPPRALDPTRFAVQVSGKNGKPVTGARVTADLTMPAMSMPESTVALPPTAPGRYAGQGRFSMTGAWAVTVTVKNGKRQTAQSFPVAVR